MKCPNCGFEPTKGRPKKLNDKEVLRLHKKNWSLSEIANKLGVTRGAIQASLRRSN